MAAPADRDFGHLSARVESGACAARRSNTKIDARDTYLWHFRLQRLEAEPIWDSIHYAAGDLDLAVGGKSFQLSTPTRSRRSSCRKTTAPTPDTNRRGVYMTRGYIPSTDVMNNFLTSFDVDDGRTPCPIRTQTVTAPQALFTMNGDLVEKESEKLAAVVLKESSGDLRRRSTLAYQRTLGRKPSRLRTGLRAHLYRQRSGAHEGTGVAAVQSGRVYLRQVNMTDLRKIYPCGRIARRRFLVSERPPVSWAPRSARCGRKRAD